MLALVEPPAFPQLLSILDGRYDCRPKNLWARMRNKDRAGWVTVDRDSNGDMNLMWTSDRDTHYAPIPGLNITLEKDTGALICFMKSVLSFHTVWGYGRARPGALEEATEFAEWCTRKLVIEAETRVRTYQESLLLTNSPNHG